MPIFKVLNPFLLVFNFIMVLLFGLLLLYFFGKFWFNEFYGKYINQVSELISEISGEEKTTNFGSDLFRTKNKKTFISKTEPFFNKIFGKSGGVFNVLFWVFVFILGILILSFVAGFIVGYLGIALK